ncbi:MAG: Nif3-like dinuclear metal center hexameric protein [Defluviitaleaceae bacterium]|nr:Nif3-like dinuclear metal center hexameric protein [Defluviitaleaceae bacterium]
MTAKQHRKEHTMTAEKIIKILNEWSPESCAEEWDNVGLLIGDSSQPVRKVLVALDATEAVINEAVSENFDFLITHHPLIYNPIKKITTADPTGRKILTLIKNGIGIYCAHTNLDKAPGGVNDCLAEKIGLEKIAPLIPESENEPESENIFGIGRTGYLKKETTLAQLIQHIKSVLNLPSLRFSGNSSKILKKIAVCGGDGSGNRYIDAAIAAECDAYVTGDLRYHAVQDALESGIALIDITHYGGEILVVDAIVARLKNYVEIFPSSIDGQVFETV